jgi:signal transduction histidine kinase/ketosteroid isomerase-like protein
VTELRSIVDRHLRAFNARDFDALIQLLHEDVEITVDSGTLRGVDAARAYTTGTVRAYPGVLAQLERVVAESGDSIVVEYRLVNPAGDVEGAWSLKGLVCEVFQVRDGRVAALRSYYSPTAADRTDVAQVPSRAEAARIAGEQAALRRVAALVAPGVSQDALFAAVNEEVARLVGADATALMRFEPDDTVTLVAAWSGTDVSFPVGERRPVNAELRAVRETGRPVRFGSAGLPHPGLFVERECAPCIRSSVGVPIVVDGRVWGVSFASSSCEELLAGDTEARVAGFTELVASAIANAQARSKLRLLADEQAALRHVAELVARGVAPDEVFDVVALEASRLLGGHATALLRYHPDGDATVVAIRGGAADVGLRVPGAGDGIVPSVLRTCRPARIDRYEGVSGSAAALAREIGVGAAVGAPIAVAGRVWGLITAMSPDVAVPAGTEDRLAEFAALVAAAIGNAESRAELTASRARVVAAADESRRRIQRDLHDGAQQRLMHTVVTLKLARDALADAGSPESELVAEALDNAQQATNELRELARGIMPAALSHGGLRAGVESLADHVALPVEVDVWTERLPPALETTAYFIVAEGLTNVVKHAGARHAQVRAVLHDDALQLEVRDDGAGGADRTRGSGLVGLADRVDALGGTITIDSPPGEGTAIVVELPQRPRRSEA